MKGIYQWLTGFLVFYFVSYLFKGILIFNDPQNNFDGVFIAAFIFGVVVALLPVILGFFKIKENNGALLLAGLVVNFVYYFVGYYVLKLIVLADTGSVTFFHSAFTVAIGDKVLGLILISLVSSAIIVALQALSKRK